MLLNVPKKWWVLLIGATDRRPLRYSRREKVLVITNSVAEDNPSTSYITCSSCAPSVFDSNNIKETHVKKKEAVLHIAHTAHTTHAIPSPVSRLTCCSWPKIRREISPGAGTPPPERSSTASFAPVSRPSVPRKFFSPKKNEGGEEAQTKQGQIQVYMQVASEVALGALIALLQTKNSWRFVSRSQKKMVKSVQYKIRYKECTVIRYKECTVIPYTHAVYHKNTA